MRVLLDESLPRRLAAEFGIPDVKTVHEMGWAGKRNGELLRLAERQFDVFITVDRGLPHQQELDRLDLAVVILSAPNNRLETLAPLVAQVVARLPELVPGEVWKVTGRAY